MRAFQQYSIPALWIAWLLYWTVAAIGTKPTRRTESLASRLSHVVPLAIGVALLASQHMPMDWLTAPILPPSEAFYWCGLLLVLAGLGFSITARVWLGRNWSGMVTLKQDHELIRGGPYRWVRHPIYTGLLLAFVGSALALGEWRGVLAVALASAAFRRKIVIEERFLGEQFGVAWRRYCQDVPALLPVPRRSGA